LKNTKNHPTLRSGAVLIIAPMCGKRSLSTDGHQTHKKGKKNKRTDGPVQHAAAASYAFIALCTKRPIDGAARLTIWDGVQYIFPEIQTK
jgi:hypothetical protein